MRSSAALTAVAAGLLALFCAVAVADEPSPEVSIRVELGRRLFYDADLSINGTMSCATCHEQRHGFADGNRSHPGALDDPGRRNVPGLANVGRMRNLTWADDTLDGLERQALNPLTGTHPLEMAIGGREAEVMARLAADTCYPRLFRSAFPESEGVPNMARVTAAIAAFERTIVSDDTPWDRAVRAGVPLSDPSAERGRALFAAKGCEVCHTPPLFTDDAFHRVRKSDVGEIDLGLIEVSGRERDRLVFRTPGLRNVAITAPYWHDGRASTLADAIRLHEDPSTAREISPEEITDIGAFLRTLTDETLVSDQRLSLPPARCPLP